MNISSKINSSRYEGIAMDMTERATHQPIEEFPLTPIYTEDNRHISVKQNRNKCCTILHQYQNNMEPQQLHALGRVLRFFALMLLFTLIAKGTAGATMAMVKLTTACPGIIENKMTFNANIVPAKKITIGTDVVLPITSIMVDVGQAIQKGEPILQLNAISGEQLLSKKKAEEMELQIRLSTLLKDEPISTLAIQSAQMAVNFAQEDRERIYTTESATDEEKRSADRALEQAVFNLSQAQAAYNENISKAETQKQANQAQAGILSVELDSLLSEIKDLQYLSEQNWQLLAPEDGIIENISCDIGQSSSATCVILSSDANGYCLWIDLTKEQCSALYKGQNATVSQNNNTIIAPIESIQAYSEHVWRALVRIPNSFQNGAARVDITLSSTRHDTCIPIEALRQDNEGFFVYAVKSESNILGLQNTVIRCPVIVEEFNAITAAVLGIGDENIIVSSSKAVKEGERVRITE